MNRGRVGQFIGLVLFSLVLQGAVFAQEIVPTGEYSTFETRDLAAFDRDWIVDVPSQTEAIGVSLESTLGGLLVTLAPETLNEVPRIAVRPTDTVPLRGYVRTIHATVDASSPRAVQLRVIVTDGFGIEYKIPTSYWGLPVGEYRATIAPPPFVYRNPSRRQHLQFAGFELVPLSDFDEAATVRFISVAATVESPYPDADAPEEW